MKLPNSVAKLFSGNVATAVIQFAAIAGFTKLLGTGPVGSFFVFQALVGMIGIPADLGVSKATEKHLSSNEPVGEVLVTSVLVKALLVTPWVVGLFLFATSVENYIGIEGILPFVAAGLVVSQAYRLSLRLLAGQLRVEQNALLKVIGEIVWVVGGFALVSAGWGATALVASYILGRLTTVLGVLVRFDLELGLPTVQRTRDLANFGRYVIVGDIDGYIYQWMDVTILRLFVPVSLIGAYEIAWRVGLMSIMLTNAIRTSLFPQISNWYERDMVEKIESAFYTWVQVTLFVTIPAFAGAIVLGKDILGTMFNAQATVAYPVLVIFMLEKILRSVQLVIGPSLYAMNKPHLGYRGSAAAIVTNLTLNFTLIPVFGLVGAAIATTMGAAVAAVISIRYVSTFIPIRVPWSRIGWSVLSSAVMLVGVSAVRTLIPAGWVRLITGLAVGVTLYFALLFYNQGIRIEVRNVLRDRSESS